MILTDFLQKDGDLIVQNGDFLIGESDEQHIEDITVSFPGWWKEFASLGVGIFQYLNGSGREQEIERNIRVQLQSDGYNVQNARVEYDNQGKLIVYPNAVRD